MEQPNVERRLAAVLAADVVGYSRLMEIDETGTLARLKTDPARADRSRHREMQRARHQDDRRRHAGRIPRASPKPLRCASDFQRRMARRNQDMPAPGAASCASASISAT